MGIGVSALGGLAGGAQASGVRTPSDDAMGVLVDLTIFNGCRRCEAACQQTAGFNAPSPDELADRGPLDHPRDLEPDRYTVVNRFDTQDGESAGRPVYVKANCLHCVDPACVSACIVHALTKCANGAVLYDPNKCMGCRYCMVASPFETPRYEYDNVPTPQVRKCTFCSNEGHPNKGGVPACVQACPKECLVYGRRSDLLARAHAKIKGEPHTYVDHVYGEHEAGGTSWLYLSSVPFDQVGFLNVASAAPPRLSEAIQHGVFKHFLPPIAWCGILGLAMWLSRPEPKVREGDVEPNLS